MTHTFEFSTPATHNDSKSLQNIIYIKQEDEKKHFIQYIQFEELKLSNGKNAIKLINVNVKVDRSYFLEIANICLDDRQRRRQLFSTLGKRRFGANNKRHDYYLINKNTNTKILEKSYDEYNKENLFTICYSESTDASTNQYRVFHLKIAGLNYAYIDQINITKRKKYLKNFCVELLEEEVELLNSIKNKKERIDYIFNKIGKIYFKSLQSETITLSPDKDARSLALSRIIKESADMELASRVNDNRVFRQLKEKRELMERIDLSLHKHCFNYSNNPHDETQREALSLILETFINHTKELSQLDEISAHLVNIKILVETKALNYILDKNDNDLKDILLYTLEMFTLWNKYLYEEEEDIKGFNIATVDLIAALRHLIDMCYKFKHEYKCHDAEQGKEELLVIEAPVEVKAHQESLTSAEDFFRDVHLDGEIYDELREIESEIEGLFYAQEYTLEINDSLILFFKRYTYTLNPLFEFKDLSYSFMLLSQKLSEYELRDNGELLIALMRGLISDILEWKKSVLVDQTAEDIHYMDKSFYANIAQIEMSLEDLEINTDENFGDDDFIEFF
ncbi:MAG: hypothetical protein U9N39_09830 [Campylobacterota bacterium]|nr:hypothetical protein [Campylobacterota bacterium]